MARIATGIVSSEGLNKARSCGACTACCTVLEVPELDKKMQQPCKHLCETGCSVYPDRPPVCQEFKCSWLSGMFSEEQRPDKFQIMFRFTHPTTPFGQQFLIAFELIHGAASKPEAAALISKLSNGGFAVCIVSPQ